MSELVVTEAVGHVAMLRLNRPETQNALSPEMMDAIAAELARLDSEPHVRCIVVAGCDQVFAAGADIKVLSERGFAESLHHPSATFWKQIAMVKTPMIAAVSGWALGGGCELALACDMIVASEDTQFGQPEITLGIIPGGGATQRLTRVLGKQRAMEFVLTGRRFDAKMASEWGLVAVVAKKGRWMQEAMVLADTVGERPPIAARLAKQAVLAADESGLSSGLETERRLFELAMATEDRVEGMQAFLEKRKPHFQGR